MWTLFFRSRLDYYKLVFALIASTLAWFAQILMFSYFFAVPQFPITPQQLDFSRGFLKTIYLMLFNTFVPLLRISIFDYFDFMIIKLTFMVMLAGIFFMGVKLTLLNKEWHRGAILFFVIILTQCAMYFLAIDYKPYVDLAYFEPYHFGLYFLFLTTSTALAIDHTLRLFFKQNKATKIIAVALATVVLSCITHYSHFKSLTRELTGSSLEIANAHSLVRHIEDNLTSKNSCIIVNDDIPLFLLMIYGNLSYKISFNHLCSETSNFYSNSIPPKDCKLMLITKHNCTPQIKLKVLKEEGIFLLGEVIK